MDASSSSLLPELAYTKIGSGGIEFLHIYLVVYFVTVVATVEFMIMTSGASRMRLRAPRISKFSGGACPQTPLGGAALRQLPY